MAIERTTYSKDSTSVVRVKAKAFAALLKFRLSSFVVISALFGYLMAVGTGALYALDLLWLAIGGFLVTGASNALNQVIETEQDKLMKRTADRPMPQGILGQTEAVVFALLIGIIGVLILGFVFNLVAALLGIISLLLYAFVYTPLKRVHSIGVLVGAIPGAMPPLIGWAAFTGGIETGAIILFLFQFLWQFPHFWAIAWILHEDYQKAGFKMLPSKTGKSSFTATLILIYTALLVPACLLPLKFGMANWIVFSLLVAIGLGFLALSYKLLKKLDNKSAKQLMFGSFLYLILMQGILIAGNIF